MKSLLMTPADVINELNTSMVDVAVRLRNCSTTDITGDQIVALVPLKKPCISTRLFKYNSRFTLDSYFCLNDIHNICVVF